MRVFVISIIFANVEHRQLPELRKVHGFVEHALAKRALTKKTDGDAPVPNALGRERRTGGDTGAARDHRTRTTIAGFGVRTVHRSAFSAAVTRLVSQQFGKHSVR